MLKNKIAEEALHLAPYEESSMETWQIQLQPGIEFKNETKVKYFEPSVYAVMTSSILTMEKFEPYRGHVERLLAGEGRSLHFEQKKGNLKSSSGVVYPFYTIWLDGIEGGQASNAGDRLLMTRKEDIDSESGEKKSYLVVVQVILRHAYQTSWLKKLKEDQNTASRVSSLLDKVSFSSYRTSALTSDVTPSEKKFTPQANSYLTLQLSDEQKEAQNICEVRMPAMIMGTAGAGKSLVLVSTLSNMVEKHTPGSGDVLVVAASESLLYELEKIWKKYFSIKIPEFVRFVSHKTLVLEVLQKLDHPWVQSILMTDSSESNEEEIKDDLKNNIFANEEDFKEWYKHYRREYGKLPQTTQQKKKNTKTQYIDAAFYQISCSSEMPKGTVLENLLCRTVYQELRVISAWKGYVHENKKVVGRKDSYFIDSPNSQDFFTKVYNAYERHLINIRKIDLALLNLTSEDLEKIKGFYSAILGDEFQDCSTAMCKFLTTLSAGKIAVFLDSLQSVRSDKPIWNTLKSVLMEYGFSGEPFVLPETYRLPEAIAEVANRIGDIRHFLAGGTGHKGQTRMKVAELHKQKEGYAHIFSPRSLEEEKTLIDEILTCMTHYASNEIVIITYQDEKAVRQCFGIDEQILILTPEKAKGLQFKLVIKWDPLGPSSPAFDLYKEANHKLASVSNEELLNTCHQSTSESADNQYSRPFQELFTGVTRAQHRLIFCQKIIERSNEYIISCLKESFPPVTPLPAEKLQEEIAVESDDWKEKIILLLLDEKITHNTISSVQEIIKIHFYRELLNKEERVCAFLLSQFFHENGEYNQLYKKLPTLSKQFIREKLKGRISSQEKLLDLEIPIENLIAKTDEISPIKSVKNKKKKKLDMAKNSENETKETIVSNDLEITEIVEIKKDSEEFEFFKKTVEFLKNFLSEPVEFFLYENRQFIGSSFHQLLELAKFLQKEGATQEELMFIQNSFNEFFHTFFKDVRDGVSVISFFHELVFHIGGRKEDPGIDFLEDLNDDFFLENIQNLSLEISRPCAAVDNFPSLMKCLCETKPGQMILLKFLSPKKKEVKQSLLRRITLEDIHFSLNKRIFYLFVSSPSLSLSSLEIDFVRLCFFVIVASIHKKERESYEDIFKEICFVYQSESAKKIDSHSSVLSTLILDESPLSGKIFSTFVEEIIKNKKTTCQLAEQFLINLRSEKNSNKNDVESILFELCEFKSGIQLFLSLLDSNKDFLLSISHFIGTSSAYLSKAIFKNTLTKVIAHEIFSPVECEEDLVNLINREKQERKNILYLWEIILENEFLNIDGSKVVKNSIFHHLIKNGNGSLFSLAIECLEENNSIINKLTKAIFQMSKDKNEGLLSPFYCLSLSTKNYQLMLYNFLTSLQKLTEKSESKRTYLEGFNLLALCVPLKAAAVQDIEIAKKMEYRSGQSALSHLVKTKYGIKILQILLEFVEEEKLLKHAILTQYFCEPLPIFNQKTPLELLCEHSIEIFPLLKLLQKNHLLNTQVIDSSRMSSVIIHESPQKIKLGEYFINLTIKSYCNTEYYSNAEKKYSVAYKIGKIFSFIGMKNDSQIIQNSLDMIKEALKERSIPWENESAFMLAQNIMANQNEEAVEYIDLAIRHISEILDCNDSNFFRDMITLLTRLLISEKFSWKSANMTEDVNAMVKILTIEKAGKSSSSLEGPRLGDSRNNMWSENKITLDVPPSEVKSEKVYII